jgi:ribosome-associated toxin RatA of RatAB toxin-antitoxin module
LKPEAYPRGYVEDFDEPRTKLADFFSILLILAWFSMGLYNYAMLWRAMIAIGCLLLGWSGWSCAAEPVELDVHTEPTGGVRATATILFPVEPAIIQRLLTDYAHWPDLFDVRMRMAEIREQDGKAFTDIRIDHAMLPGEQRLLTETRTLPTGGILTELKGGDFKQYRRFWKLTPVDGGAHTRAEFELLFEIDSLRRDLETHFRIIREKALAQAQLQSGR